MPDLWQVLGYDAVIDRLSEGLQEVGGLQLISGPPGVGKSSIAAELGRRWDAAGGVGLIALGDSGRGDSAYYPFNYALGGLANRWKALTPIAYGAGRVAETFVGTGGTLTTTVQALAELPGKRRQRRTRFLGEAAQQVLHDLERRGKKRPTLLVADNVHWWDGASLDLLRMLLSWEMRDAFPFLERLRVLAIETPAPYQIVESPGAYDSLLASGWTRRFDLHRPPRARFREVLVALGAPQSLEHGAADEIYALSGGHLLLARRAAEYLTSRGVITMFAAADAEDFQRMLLTQRVHSLGGLGRQTLELLQVASFLGLSFRQDQILCAYGHDESAARQLLRSCREERVLDLDEQTYRFAHDIFRSFFGVSNVADPISIHERLLSCMRILQPGDYATRSITASKAERAGDAGMLAVQAALQLDRDGADWRAALAESVRSAIVATGLSGPLDLLVAARAASARYDFAECQRLLNHLPHGLAESLRAEADYLRAMCLMSTRSEDDRSAGRDLLRRWAGFEDTEPELGLRLMRQLLYGLAMVRDKAEARALEHRIRTTLDSRVSFDGSAADDLYTLDRCSGAVDTPDVALVRTREAARHFAPQPGETTIRRPLEYYRSLVNFGANLICNAEYAEAVQVHERLLAIVIEYENGVFPRTDYPRSNAVLARYRHGTLTARQAAGHQRQILDEHGNPADPFYGQNALAVYLTLDGQYGEALAIFDDLADRLRRLRRKPEPSMLYLVGANRVVTRFLADATDDAAVEWQALSALLPQIAYTTAPYLERRHDLLSAAFLGTESIDPPAFDRYVVSRHPDEYGPLWDNYGRGFRLPEVEFWRES